jgi:two-component system NarL family response regulator
MDQIRIVVADDHPIVREGLSAIINAQPDMHVVAEAGNGEEAVEVFRSTRPDVLLLDLVMPKMSGQDALKEIRKQFQNARVIVLTSFQGEEDIYRALQGGARAYLQKEAPCKVLLETIRAVHAGQRRIPSEVAARLASRIPSSDLTPREMDVLKLIVNGLSNKEIAAQLHTTEGTIKGYVSNILVKLGVSDRTQAATAALQRGIVHLD